MQNNSQNSSLDTCVYVADIVLYCLQGCNSQMRFYICALKSMLPLCSIQLYIKILKLLMVVVGRLNEQGLLSMWLSTWLTSVTLTIIFQSNLWILSNKFKPFNGQIHSREPKQLFDPKAPF